MTLRLLDIIPLEDLQRLQDSFAEISNMGSIITHVNGEPITTPSNFAPFCVLMRSKEATRRNCMESDRLLGQSAYVSGHIAFSPCSNLNLRNVAAPIALNGTHLANWLFGPIKLHEAEEADISAFALAAGHCREEVRKAYEALPMIGREYFERTAKLLALFAENLSLLCFKNHKLMQLDKSKDLAVLSLEMLLDSVDISIQIIDPATYEMVYINACLCRILGKERGYVLSQPCYKGTRDEEAPCANCPHQYLIDAQGRPVPGASHQWEITRNGRVFMLNDRMIRWHDGRILHLQTLIDITERKALAMAEAANQAKRDFLSHMSHELRTPMNGVLGLTHLALQSEEPDMRRRYLQKIQDSASLLLGIINDVLDFSKIEAGKMELAEETFSLSRVVGSACDMILPRTVEKNIQFAVSLPPDLPDALRGDPLRVTQILLNLLGNAVKFTKEGEVRLSFRHEPAAPDAAGERLLLHCSVADTGIGISPSGMAQLFKPFAQADASVARNFGGTGLGLAISRHLIESMGGALSVSSEVGRGSVFSFHLNLGLAGPARGQTAGAATGERSAPALEGLAVLLAEDNPINQEIAAEVLKNMGASVVDVAATGLEAVNMHAAGSYDLILMDIQMPEMDGYAAARAIRESGKPGAEAIPIIAMTANAMREDREKSLNAGMDEHLPKPVEFGKMEEILRRFAARGARG